MCHASTAIIERYITSQAGREVFDVCGLFVSVTPRAVWAILCSMRQLVDESQNCQKVDPYKPSTRHEVVEMQ